MSEFDLIPASYRAERAAIDSLRLAATCALVVVLIGVATGVLLRIANERAGDQLAAITAQSNAQAVINAKYQLLAGARATLREQNGLLSSLDSRGATTELLSVVEQARLSTPVWLKRWDYRSSRVGPRLVHRVALRGDATTHEALTTFVGQLLSTPAVADVRIAAANASSPAQRVDFQLELELASR